MGLCGIEGGVYDQSDLVILSSLLKNSKVPPSASAQGMSVLILSLYKKFVIDAIHSI